MDVILSAMVQKVLEFLLPLLVVAVMSLVTAKAKELLERAKAEQPTVTALLMEAARVAVTAAEQAGAAQLINDKKRYAFDIAEAWLMARGVKLDLELIDGAIEAAVYENFPKEKDTKSVAIG